MTDKPTQNALLAQLLRDGKSPVLVENAAQRSNSLLRMADGTPLKELPALPLLPALPARPTYKPAKLFGMVRELEMYGTIELWGASTSQYARLKKYECDFDWYCPGCRMQTPWRTEVSESTHAQTKGFEGISSLVNRCRRDERHSEVIFIEFTDVDRDLEGADVPAIIRKIGQTPSLAEFHSNDVAAFEKVTTRAQRSDYLKSVQAFAQGFAAGACTYLRRVVEGIMDEERDAEMKEKGITEWKDYERADTKGRMKLLGARLPEFLVENPMLYKVLSHGIHSLSEEDCAALYPRLRDAIHLLFDDRLERYRKQKHRENVAKELAKVQTGTK